MALAASRRSGTTLAIAAIVVAMFPKCLADGLYDPCSESGSVNIGDPFTIGLAFWPGGTAPNWGPSSNSTAHGQLGLNPCTLGPDGTDARRLLAAAGITFSTFVVRADALSSLRVARAEQDASWDALTAAAGVEGRPFRKPVVSVVAFRGSKRSPAAYLRSASEQDSGGTGVVASLAVRAAFDAGSLVDLVWQDIGSKCAGCGGSLADRCVRTPDDRALADSRQLSCATDLAECGCRGIACSQSNCTSEFTVAFQGTDARGRSMASGGKLDAAREHTLAGLLSGLLEKAASSLPSLGDLEPGAED